MMNVMGIATAPTHETAVLHVGGLHYASEKARVEHALCARPGVLAVDANPVAQTATVTYDPDRTSVESLTRWIAECGYRCAGESVPGEEHGHGGHGGMSMEAMARDMRNRFLVALAFTLPILLWSSVGTNLLGAAVAALVPHRNTWVLGGHWSSARL